MHRSRFHYLIHQQKKNTHIICRNQASQSLNPLFMVNQNMWVSMWVLHKSHRVTALSPAFYDLSLASNIWDLGKYSLLASPLAYLLVKVALFFFFCLWHCGEAGRGDPKCRGSTGTVFVFTTLPFHHCMYRKMFSPHLNLSFINNV